MGPRASQVQGQLWDPVVLEQWSAAIATPSMWAAQCGLAGPHDLGTDFIQQVLLEPQRMWPGGAMVWALRELQLHHQAERQDVPQAALN